MFLTQKQYVLKRYILESPKNNAVSILSMMHLLALTGTLKLKVFRFLDF